MARRAIAGTCWPPGTARAQTAWEVFGTDNLYLNPGSVSIPKAGTPHSYMTLENGVFTWKELGGDVYHTLTL